MERQLILRRIVSGGQTGVDRGALDAAIQLGLDHGGWCPRGRRAEDGRIPSRYRLVETESPLYPVRTRRNVDDSDATLLIYRDRLYGGTELTYRTVRQSEKPFLLVDVELAADPNIVRAWLIDARVKTLNVAGPRESTAPGISAETCRFLIDCLRTGAG